MASISPTIFLHLVFTLLLLLIHPALSDHSPAYSPSPPPSDQIPPPPSSSPSISWPPASPPSDLAPTPNVADENSPSSSPSPSPSLPPTADSGDINRETQPNAADLESKESSGGMSGGQKAGVAIGVIAGVLVVGASVLVYKKRKHNIQRSQYGSAARRDIL